MTEVQCHHSGGRCQISSGMPHSCRARLLWGSKIIPIKEARLYSRCREKPYESANRVGQARRNHWIIISLPIPVECPQTLIKPLWVTYSRSSIYTLHAGTNRTNVPMKSSREEGYIHKWEKQNKNHLWIRFLI